MAPVTQLLVVLLTVAHLLYLVAGGSIASCAAQNGTVAWSLFAGGGPPGYTGDGGSAASSSLSFPRKMSVANVSDPVLYVSDSGNRVVRALSTSSSPTIETVLPGGAWPFAALNRLLASAQVVEDNRRFWMVLADAQLHVVWGVAPPAGGLQVTVVAGMLGVGGFNGDGLNASACQLYQPVDAIYLASAAIYYIADLGNFRVRAVRTQGASQTLGVATVAGTGAPPVDCANVDVFSARVAPAALLHVSDAMRSWLVIADQGAACIRALDLPVRTRSSFASPAGVPTRLCGLA